MANQRISYTARDYESIRVELQNYVRPYMTMFEDKTFLEFTRFNDFPISNIAHPLEEAHQQAAKLIKSYNLL